MLLSYEMEGEGLGDLVTCDDCQSGRQRAYAWGVVTNHYNLCIDQPQVYQTTSCTDTAFWTLQSQFLGQDMTKRTWRFFVRHCPPPCVYPSFSLVPSLQYEVTYHCIHHCACDWQYPSGLPRWSKSGQWQRPEKEASQYIEVLLKGSFITSLFASSILPLWLAYFLSFWWRWTLQGENRSL